MGEPNYLAGNRPSASRHVFYQKHLNEPTVCPPLFTGFGLRPVDELRSAASVDSPPANAGITDRGSSG